MKINLKAIYKSIYLWYNINRMRLGGIQIMENTNEIREDWYEHYKTLEAIRASGIVNMYGAAPYLADWNGIDEKLAKQVLLNWMHNYSKLSEMFGWR